MTKKLHPPNNIKEIRKDRGLTVKELGEKVGLSGPYITMLENRQKALYYTRVQEIAQALECHPSEIMGDSPTKPQSKEEKELLDHFGQLSDQEQADFIKMAELWVRRTNK